MPKKCEKTCGLDSGEITQITKSQVVIETHSTTDNVSVKKTFSLGPNTKENGTLKEGAPVTVYYRRDSSVAERIELIQSLNGVLVPGNDPDPPLPASCLRLGPVPADALRVYMGGNAGYSTADQVTVLAVRGVPVLSLHRLPGGIAVNAETYSEDGRMVAEITENRFSVNPDNFFKLVRPDNHSLAVYDRENRDVLDVRYINSHSVRVLGTFRLPGSAPLVIEEDAMSLRGTHISESCFAGGKFLLDEE